MGSSPSPPKEPDAAKTALAQGDVNLDTARAQQGLNQYNQVTPYGDITYAVTGGNYLPALGGGTQWVPTYTATTKLNQTYQNLSDWQASNAQNNLLTGNALRANTQGMLSNNIDLGPSATEDYLNRLATHTLDPQWAHEQQGLNQHLADQGLTPGSEGWKYAQTQFGLNKSNAYNNYYLAAHDAAVRDMLAQYNQPLTTMTALQGLSQYGMPGIGTLAPSPQAQVQPPNYEGMVQSNYAAATQQYQAQMAAHSAMMGGLFGLGGQALGAVGGMLSDRRDKKDVEKLGKRGGVDMYAYRYKKDAPNTPKTVGPMAQDIEKKYPGSTTEIGGHKVIRFGIGPRKAA